MSERPFTPPGDDDLDAALRARRRLVPKFDTHLDDEPSPELDRLVLSRAREALRRETPAERHYRSPRWAAPVAIAATVLLSLGLVLQMDPSRNDAVLDAAGDAAGDATAMATTDPAVPELAAPPPPAAPPPAASPAAASPAATQAPATPPASAPRDISAWAAPAPNVDSALTADPPSTAEPAPTAAARIDSVAESRRAAEAGASGVSRAAARLEVDQAAKSAPPAAASASSATSAAEFAEVAAADAAIPRDDPQRWLAAIEQLRLAGDVDAARRELAAFRRRHPALPVPDALDALR